MRERQKSVAGGFVLGINLCLPLGIASAPTLHFTINPIAKVRDANVSAV